MMLACQANPRDAIAAPTNAGVGDCTSTLASGSTCALTSNAGYSVSGTSSCTTAKISVAPCTVCVYSPCIRRILFRRPRRPNHAAHEKMLFCPVRAVWPGSHVSVAGLGRFPQIGHFISEQGFRFSRFSKQWLRVQILFLEPCCVC